MKLWIYATIGSMGALAIGCQSQESAYSASISLQAEAEDERAALYDQVHLIAGSGAEEDEPDEADEAEMAEPADEPDASIADRIAEEEGWSDDSGACGNGALDDGELCDYGILVGRGACPESCEPPPECPDESLVVRGCMTRCVPHDEPSPECLAARQ